MAARSGFESGRAIGRPVGALVAASTALILVALAIVPFLSPAWVRFEQDRTDVGSLTGFSAAELDIVAGGLLGDLALWQGDFRVTLDGQPVLNDREVSHMLDVRAVLWGGFALAALGAALTLIVLTLNRAPHRRAAVWRAVAAGARATTIGVLVIGAFAVLAFPVFFETFHRLFFSEGTYLFDPATERLVQLFPTQFWSDTTIAIGGLVLILSIVVGWLAARRARTVIAAAEPRAPGWGTGRAGAAGRARLGR
ncbi:MAG: DUF1461 domain-containing protein [Chloroflexi bacterium]|nr:DUF1461 domain-containing protein [Chloroflexota bacterium]